MTDSKRTITTKLATLACLIVLIYVVRSTGALQSSTNAEYTTGTAEDVTARHELQATHASMDGTPTVDTQQSADNPQLVITPHDTVGIPGDTPDTSSHAGQSSLSSTAFRDGTYLAQGSYSSPGGTQSITVTIVLAGDTVVDSSVGANATSQPSRKYQEDFIDHYKQFVVGKKISTLDVANVSGSSLTPIGFNNAVDNIEAQARM